MIDGSLVLGRDALRRERGIGRIGRERRVQLGCAPAEQPRGLEIGADGPCRGLGQLPGRRLDEVAAAKRPVIRQALD